MGYKFHDIAGILDIYPVKCEAYLTGVHPVTAGRPACHRENSSLGYPQQRNEFAGKTCSWNTVCIRHERAGAQKKARN